MKTVVLERNALYEAGTSSSPGCALGASQRVRFQRTAVPTLSRLHEGQSRAVQPPPALPFLGPVEGPI